MHLGNSATDANAIRPSEAWFLTTHWSVVLSAREKDSPRSAEALENLCRAYWRPLYAFVRRRDYSSHDAEDMVQEFFARLLQREYLKALDPEKGRFRTFLIMAMKRFLANEWDRVWAQKRGSGQAVMPLDTARAESLLSKEALTGMPSDKTYDRQWALTLLDRALGRLEQERKRLGKAAQFKVLSRYLAVGKDPIPYGNIMIQLRISEAAARMAVHRLRRRFRQVFREEIAQTLSNPADIESEIKYLLGILGK